MSKNSKPISEVVGSTPHFPLDDSRQEEKRSQTKTSFSNIRTSEFQTEDMDNSRVESLHNLSNIENILKSVDDEFYKAKPVNPLAFKEDPDKSIDMSMNSMNNSQISENKLHSYAQKTKKLNMDKLKSFKTLNFTKSKNIETKYDDEFSHIDDKSKAVYNVCESFSSNVINNKHSSNNVMGQNRITNPFNISSKINKFHPSTNNEGEKQTHTVKFNIDESKEGLRTTTNSKHENKIIIEAGSILGNETLNSSFKKSKADTYLDNSFQNGKGTENSKQNNKLGK